MEIYFKIIVETIVPIFYLVFLCEILQLTDLTSLPRKVNAFIFSLRIVLLAAELISILKIKIVFGILFPPKNVYFFLHGCFLDS